MRAEWDDVRLPLVPYRGDSGIMILAGVDEVTLLMDDQVVKTQTMRGSPFIKPFIVEIRVCNITYILLQSIYIYTYIYLRWTFPVSG